MKHCGKRWSTPTTGTGTGTPTYKQVITAVEREDDSTERGNGKLTSKVVGL